MNTKPFSRPKNYFLYWTERQKTDYNAKKIIKQLKLGDDAFSSVQSIIDYWCAGMGIKDLMPYYVGEYDEATIRAIISLCEP